MEHAREQSHPRQRASFSETAIAAKNNYAKFINVLRWMKHTLGTDELKESMKV